MIFRTLLFSAAMWAAAGAAAAEPVMVEPIRYAADAAKAFTERYGDRERTYLSTILSQRLTDRLRRAGAELGSGGVELETEVVSISPNRPTVKELADKQGLSPNSIRRGGARLRSRFVDADGRTLASFETYNDGQAHLLLEGNLIWDDALQTFDIHARKAADTYTSRIKPREESAQD
jgi:hypothetical protein